MSSVNTTSQSAAQVVSEVTDVLSSAAGIAASLDPEIAPFVVLGQAAAAALPGIITDIQALINNTQPSAADVSALAAKIQSLATPQSL